MLDRPRNFGFSLKLTDEAATGRFAEDIASMLRHGDLVALSGGLGVGKTSFARALIRALAGDPRLEVPSPTFAIRIDHVLPRLTVAHADLYRIGSANELDEIGMDEALADGAVLIEWPELLPPGFAQNRLAIALDLDGQGRIADVEASGTWPSRLTRTLAARKFIDRAGWTDASRRPLVGDASTRAYERVVFSGRTAILMNAPMRQEGPANYGGRSYDAVAHRALDVRPFVAIDRALIAAGFRAPGIIAEDLESGLVLLEDLGSDGILDADGAPILRRYEAAIDVLIAMHGRQWPAEAPLPDGTVHRLPPYDRDALLVEVSLFPDWFGGRSGEPALPADGREAFLAIWSRVLDLVVDNETTWVMRDFHSPNILWQEGASGTDRIGLLDFQDALIGHPAYDVASLAQDARATLTEAQEQALKARYIAGRRLQKPDFDVPAFEAAYAIFAAQRATKVLGAFTRLALAEGKTGYQRHRSRLKALLRRTLVHPVLSDLRLWYEPYI